MNHSTGLVRTAWLVVWALLVTASFPSFGATQRADSGSGIRWLPQWAEKGASSIDSVGVAVFPDWQEVRLQNETAHHSEFSLLPNFSQEPAKSRRPYVVVGAILGAIGGLGAYVLLADDSGDADFNASLNVPLAVLAGAGIGALGGWIAGGIAGAP